MGRTKLIVLAIFLFSFVLRVYLLDRIPGGISEDELDFILNAKAIWFTGVGFNGLWNPFLLSPATIVGFQPPSELPSLLLAPIIGPSPFSLFFARIPFVFISSLLPVLLFLVTDKLLGRKEAVIVGIVAALNPWSIFFGRTASEAPVAVTFYLCAFYLLLVLKKWKILFAFVPLFIGFYSYMGTKLIFIPFVVIVGTFVWLAVYKKRYTKQLLMLFGLCTAIFIFFLVSLHIQPSNGRVSEILSPNSETITKKVNEERRLAIESPLSPLLSNRYVVFGKEAVEKYLRVFSTDFLFLHGETRATFTLWHHGYFYYLDSFFILLGFAMLFKVNKKVWGLLLALTFIAPIPTVMSTVESGFAALRSSLLYPILMIYCGIGISSVLFVYNKRKYNIAILIVIVGAYLLLVVNFLNIYFLRNPIYNSEGFSLSFHTLSRYLKLDEQKDISVISFDPKGEFKQYLFYTDGYNRKNAKNVAQMMQDKRYKLNQITFETCQSQMTVTGQTVVIQNGLNCKIENNSSVVPTNIARLSDGGGIYTIYNDTNCKDYSLKTYPHKITIEDFEIFKLSKKEFCESFITRPEK